ncbi:hypothetical protein EPUL_006495, partial [Erysiphe pulchra]
VGLYVNLGSKEVTITRDRKIFATGPRIGITWILRAYSSHEKALKAESVSQEETLLWHRRLGHPEQEKLCLISQAVTDMPVIRRIYAPDCNTCSFTKSVRHQNREAPKNQSTQQLKRIFIDTWGPYRHFFLGENK